MRQRAAMSGSLWVLRTSLEQRKINRKRRYVSSGGDHHGMPVAEIMRRLVAGTEAALSPGRDFGSGAARPFR
jgi:hypothetical protein